MIFRQFQLFQLPEAYRLNPESFAEKLEPLLFHACLPTMPIGMGWGTLLDEDDSPVIRSFKNCIIFCLKIEEKILPATVIRQKLDEKIKEIELTQARKVYSKEKYTLKDDITQLLLPRAFSKLSRIYAYIDTQNNWLVLGTTNAKKTEHFMSMFKKSFNLAIHPFSFKKSSPILTQWLKHQDYPKVFSIEKSCVFQDPSQQSKVVRCQQQDLHANSMQTLIKEGFEVKQIGLCWNDQINFILNNLITFQSVKLQEELVNESDEIEAETKQQKFDADFLILTQSLTGLIQDVLDIFSEHKPVEQKELLQADAVTE